MSENDANPISASAGHRGERVAPRRVPVGLAVEEERQRDDRDDEVRGAVVDVPDPDAAVAGQAEVPLLQLGLEPQADGVLDGDDVLGVAERGGHRFAADAAGRAERVPHRGVQEVERGDVDDLAPPPQAAARLGVRFGAAASVTQKRLAAGDRRWRTTGHRAG